MTRAPNTPFGVDPASRAARRYSVSVRTPQTSCQCGISPRQKYSSGLPAMPELRSTPARRPLPLRGEAQIRYELCVSIPGEATRGSVDSGQAEQLRTEVVHVRCRFVEGFVDGERFADVPSEDADDSAVGRRHGNPVWRFRVDASHRTKCTIEDVRRRLTSRQ